MGGIFGAIATAAAGSTFENPYVLEQTFKNVKEDGTGISITTQAWMQVIALCITLLLSFASGALSGLVASKFPSIDYLFDDAENFEGVNYANALSRYSLTT